jgi:Arc/MetJ family transcription regulator
MATTVTIDDRLLQQAVRVSGIEQKDDVVREALNALIAREISGRRSDAGEPHRALEGVPTTSAGVLVDALDRIDDLAHLGDGWDSYGAAPIGNDAVRAARVLVIELWQSGAFAGTDQIDIIPVPTGGIQVEWAFGPRDIEIEIGHAGDLAWLINLDDGSFDELSGQPGIAARDIVERISRLDH